MKVLLLLGRSKERKGERELDGNGNRIAKEKEKEKEEEEEEERRKRRKRSTIKFGLAPFLVCNKWHFPVATEYVLEVRTYGLIYLHYA